MVWELGNLQYRLRQIQERSRRAFNNPDLQEPVSEIPQKRLEHVQAQSNEDGIDRPRRDSRTRHPAYMSDEEFNNLPNWSDVADDPVYNVKYHPQCGSTVSSSLGCHRESTDLRDRLSLGRCPFLSCEEPLDDVLMNPG